MFSCSVKLWILSNEFIFSTQYSVRSIIRQVCGYISKIYLHFQINFDKHFVNTELYKQTNNG